LFEAPLSDQGVEFGGAVLPVDRSTLSETDQSTVTVGVRPEDLEIASDNQGLAIEVDLVEELGADAFVYGRRAGADETDKPFIARVDARRPPSKGETVYFRPAPEHAHLFDTKSGQRLGDCPPRCPVRRASGSGRAPVVVVPTPAPAGTA